MGRPAPPDDGSPARLIATMVGIVGILLLGSLAWSAVGALFGALGEATAVFSNSQPTPIKLSAATATPIRPAQSGPTVTATPALLGPPSGPTPAPTEPPSGPTQVPTAPPPTPTPAVSGRAPWILLPQPAPGARVAPGPLVVEARGRGDSPITTLRLELDGAAVPTTFEQRSESTWRAAASAQVAAGRHAVRAVVIDDQGRTGSFRWTFDAGP